MSPCGAGGLVLHFFPESMNVHEIGLSYALFHRR